MCILNARLPDHYPMRIHGIRKLDIKTNINGVSVFYDNTDYKSTLTHATM